MNLSDEIMYYEQSLNNLNQEEIKIVNINKIINKSKENINKANKSNDNNNESKEESINFEEDEENLSNPDSGNDLELSEEGEESSEKNGNLSPRFKRQNLIKKKNKSIQKKINA